MKSILNVTKVADHFKDKDHISPLAVLMLVFHCFQLWLIVRSL